METLETRHLLAAVSGEVYFDTNADGIRQAGEIPAADVQVYIDQNANGRFDEPAALTTQTDADGVYSFPLLPAGDYQIRVNPEPGLVQTAPAVTFGWNDTVAQDSDGTFFRAAQLIQIDTDGTVQAIGQPTRSRMDGIVRTSDGTLIAIDSRTDEVFRVDPFNGERTRIAQSNLDIVGGLAYDRVSNSVYTLVRGGSSATNRILARIDVNTGRTDLIGGGLTGLAKVSDLTFDSTTREVVGFDDASDLFFAFDSLGRGRIISTADRAIDVEGLAIADASSLPPEALASSPFGSLFVRMFDAGDDDRTATFVANVATGQIFDAADSAEPLQPTALTRSALGNNARKLSVEAVEIRGGIDFGLTNDVIGFRLATLIPESGPGSLSQEGVTVVGGAIGEDFIEVTLNRQPVSDVVLNLTLTNSSNGNTGAVLDVDTLTFTPQDWLEPRRITISPDIDNPVSQPTLNSLTVSIDILNSDLAWRSVPAQQLPVRVLPETLDLQFNVPVINEILVEARFSSNFNEQADQYIELRGMPGQALPAGSYFVVVDETPNRDSQIHAVFDLSNQVFGANGFMVLLQSGSAYDVDFSATQIRSTSSGFSGLPGGIFTGGDGTGAIDPGFSNASYFLIQSDVVPVVGAPLDANNDGVIDPTSVGGTWSIYDGVAMHGFSIYDDQSLAPIVFIENFGEPEIRRSGRGQTLVFTEGQGYVGRIGDSIGSEYSDWVSGTVDLVGASAFGLETDPAGLFEFEDEQISYPALLDRPLDHVGSSNFVGGVRGRITVLPSAGDILNGVPASIRLPAEGVTVFVDTNGNGVRDELVFEVDPEDVVPPFDILNPQPFNADYSMTNAFPGVVITSDTLSGAFIEDDIISTRQSIAGRATGNRIFSRGPFDWFTSSSRLRFDFHNPIRSASIDVLNRNSTLAVYGRLDAYNANGDLVATSVSAPVTGNRRGTVTISAPGEEIVRIEAYADSNFSQSTIFGVFDSFSYSQLEPSAVTDQNGIYEISGLFPGQYSINILQSIETANLLSPNLQTFFVARYENFFFESEFQPNTPPSIPDNGDVFINVFENPEPGTALGIIDGSDADLTPLTYEFVGGDSTGLILQPQPDGTALLIAGEGTQLDHEAEPTRVLTVRISDQFSSVTARVTLNVGDVNEFPVVDDEELSVTEDVVVTATTKPVIGVINAIDPDTGTNEGLTYAIVGGDGASFFEIDENTGVVRLIQTPDFESVNLLNLQISVRDDQDESIVNKIVRVGDENDAPTIVTTSFAVNENQTGDLFQLQVFDEDEGQLHSFALTSPPVTDPPQESPSNAFGVRSDGTVFLKPGRTLDSDIDAPNTFWVVVSDNGSPSKVSTHRITVDLNNIDEPATIRLPSEGGAPFELSEFATNFNGQIFLELQDPEGLHSDYAFDLLPGPSSDLFTFDPITGVLKVAANQSLDFESAPSHDLEFEIFDRTGQIATIRQTITVSVLNQDEPGSILTDEIVVSETPSVGDVVGRVRAFDPENDNLTIFLIGGTAAAFFEFDSNDPFALKVTSEVVFEADEPGQPPLNIIVELRDAAGNIIFDTKTINIKLNEVNEPPNFNVDLIPTLVTSAVLSGSGFEITLPENLAVDPDPTFDPGLSRPALEFRVGQKVLDSNGREVLNENGRPQLQLPSWMRFDAETRTLVGDFSAGFSSVPELTIRALEFGPLPLATDVTLTLPTLEATNPVNRFDVNSDGQVTPLDALLVINYLNGSVPQATTLDQLYASVRFLDVSGAVNGLHQVSSLDALQVINELNRLTGVSNSPSSEPEPLIAAASQVDISGNERMRREQAVDSVLGEGNLF
ncbi:Cadherin domain protein [Neorhodopirellula pilleata]|uniref:Cadherin domain protein n=2 Tax=Neorhodopirellula pilleata TaxID=2714738 RepID=A0A5C6A823_9BACT|nr:Cadherin domain protein [Neorhodopirellula pilleata]